MTLFRSALALAIVSMVAVSAPAQVVRPHRRAPNVVVPANPQALAAMQQDLVSAIEAMKSALPIYDGNRVRSIHAAHATLLIVDEAISGAKAIVRTKPAVSDSVASKSAKTKYTAQQVAQSQSSMQQGLTYLHTAWKDLQAAAGSNPNRKAVNASNHLTKAINEATTALSLHPSPATTTKA